MTGKSRPAALMESVFLVSEAVVSLGPVSARTAGIASFPVDWENWLGTSQGIDLSVITQAVSCFRKKLHPEVLNFKDRIQFCCTAQERVKEGGRAIR